MGMFAYKAIDDSGLYKTGLVDADDLETAYNDPTVHGLNILSMKKAGKISGLSYGLSIFRINRGEILEFATNLSVVLRSGIPILDALHDLSHTSENRHLRQIIDDISEKIKSGLSFSNALSFYKRVFPNIFVRLVTIGEETGRLEQSISEVAEHLQRMDDLSKMVKRALIYPIFSLTITLGALAFWVFYVLPKIMIVLVDMNLKLPLITRLVLGASDFTKHYWYILVLAPVAFFMLFAVLKRKDTTRYYIDLIKLKIPIVKLFASNRLFAVFCEQMRILIVSGITIDRSLVIVANAVGSEVFKRSILQARDVIMTGSRISDAFRGSKFFHPLVIRMIDVGEKSGKLDEQFNFLSTFFYKKLEDVTEKLGKMIEPLLLVVVGSVFAVIILGLLLPIYDIVTQIGK